MLRQMPYPSSMDANANPVRIFQERTNFKDIRNRFELGIQESLAQPVPHRSGSLVRPLPKSGAAQQENNFADLPRRRKSERKMLRSQLVPPESNVLPVPVDTVLPAHQHGPTGEEEPQHSHVEPLQGPISRHSRAYSQPSQRVRADASLLLLTLSETEAELDHKLKVAALTRVTSSLAAKASDAKAGVNRLRTLLADRAVDPSVYEATQRERWMEERRQVAAEELLRTVRDHLSSLVKAPVSQFPPAVEAEVKDVSPTAANLQTFLNSPHRPTTRPKRRRPYPAPLPEEAFNRIRHHKQLLPLRLKVPTLRPFSQPPPKAQQTPTTGTTQNPPPPSVADAPTEPTVNSRASSSNASLNPLPSPTPLLAIILENQEDNHPLPPLQTPPSPSNVSGTNGIATIWRSTPLRSKEEILAGLDIDMDADIPEYFQGLLAELDLNAASTARLRLNSLRRPASASFQLRRVAFPTAAVPRTPKRSGRGDGNASAGVKRSNVLSAPDAPSPGVPTQPANTPSPIPTIPTHTHTNPSTTTNAPPPIHASPSRRRLSALFSLPEVLSSRRSLHNPPPSTADAYASSAPPTTTASSSGGAAQLPAMSLVSPRMEFTIVEESREAEEEAEEEAEAENDTRRENGRVDAEADADEGVAEQSKDGDKHPTVVPILPSTSAVTLSSVGTTRDARRSSVGVHSEKKILAGLRRRMSVALKRS